MVLYYYDKPQIVYVLVLFIKRVITRYYYYDLFWILLLPFLSLLFVININVHNNRQNIPVVAHNNKSNFIHFAQRIQDVSSIFMFWGFIFLKILI